MEIGTEIVRQITRWFYKYDTIMFGNFWEFPVGVENPPIKHLVGEKSLRVQGCYGGAGYHRTAGDSFDRQNSIFVKTHTSNQGFIEQEAELMGSTERGFVNRNQQKNNGRTQMPGTDNQQWFYEMECLECGHRYYANGSDIWQRKCPRCQGGRP